MVQELILSFESTDKFKVGNHFVFVTKLDRETKDFGHIIGAFIRIDGKVYKGLGVERYTHCAPWHEGEPIAIATEEF